MTIVLKTNASEAIRLDKELTTVSTLTGSLREGTSITDPTVLIEADLDDLGAVNYFEITDFGRKYFVTGMTSVRNGLVQISGHVDVLSSFKAQIRENKAIIARQEKDWNLYVNDGSFRVYQNPLVLTKKFPSGFTTTEFVLAIAGRQ